MKNSLFLCGAAILLGVSITGCEEQLDCLVNGDNVHGRIVFGNNIPIHQGSNLVIQWSTDNFSNTTGSKVESNMHGLVTVPFGACVPTNTDLQLRAFQDTNGNGSIDPGEARGLYDGTNGTDAAFLTVRVNKDSSGKITDYRPADIALDSQ